ncbi:hypothetical protein [Cryobacterium sp. PAMC25264]|uniref:hypothetical protein n=1 Tax=Cryobacterium sp. PAMC25264 TaxID=2861288 RepID=UPI001C62EA8B|nr:hypothetical protein [Cryobacterium sp. PAMC25264]QYF74616.1 hypothetical protein KY500_05395 [Cryobacterium sp. PAMC25264]
MPANFSARAILWIGIGLVAASVLIQLTRDLVFRLSDQAVLQTIVNTWWFDSANLAVMLLVPLGTWTVAASFVARLIERGTIAPAHPATRITAAGVFWTGVVLTLAGLLVGASLDSWLSSLVAQGRPSIALDALNLVVSPLRNVIVPLGLALLPASVLMKKLEARVPADESARATAD